MLEIRNALPDEAELIRDIERRSGQRFVAVGMKDLADGEPSSAAVLEERAASGGLLLALYDGEPAAFVMFRSVDEGLYIEQIDVLPEFERRRIGAALIDAVAARAREIKRQSLLLSTFRDIPWNAPYYRRLGFADIADDTLSPALAAIRQEHIERGLDESRRVFMRRVVV